MSGNYDILVEQFATWLLPILLKDSAGAAVDLTGCTAAMNVVDAGGNLVVSFTTTNGGIVLGGTAGTIVLKAPATQTGPLRPGSYKYDLLLTESDGVTKDRVIQGSWTLAQGWTPS